MGRGQTKSASQGQTSRLLDRIDPVGRFGEKNSTIFPNIQLSDRSGFLSNFCSLGQLGSIDAKSNIMFEFSDKMEIYYN